MAHSNEGFRVRAVPPTPWTPGGSGASDEGQHRRHPPLFLTFAGAASAHGLATQGPARGLVYHGWCAEEGGPCKTAFVLPSPAAGSAARTDRRRSPRAGRRRPRPLSELAAATVAAAGGTTAAAAPCGASATVFPATASRPSTPTPRTGPTATTRSRPSSGSGPASSTRCSTTARRRPAACATSAS